ncbi:MAG: YciI family protein [Ideonella sp.]|nr:YciI family protein [Ideonella sp.]
MTFTLSRLLAVVAAACLVASAVHAQSATLPAPASITTTPTPSPAKAMTRPTFLYVLRLSPNMQQDSAWTDRERGLVGAHFQYLKAATEAGQVLLAGRTNEPLDKTFGLVIFEAEDEAAARRFMEGDPAVKAGVMLATLHPYAVALKR